MPGSCHCPSQKCFGKPRCACWVSSWWNWTRLLLGKERKPFWEAPFTTIKAFPREFHPNLPQRSGSKLSWASTNWTPPSISFSHLFRLGWNLAAHNLHTWKCQESFKQAQISSASSSSSRALPLHSALSSWIPQIKCSSRVTKWPPITSHTELMRTLSCKTILGTMYITMCWLILIKNHHHHHHLNTKHKPLTHTSIIHHFLSCSKQSG